MAVESKPLFHPEVIRQHVRAFQLPDRVEQFRPKLAHWAELIRSGQADDLKETALLPDFLGDFFCELLGYTRPTDGADSYTFSREQHVEDDGKFADAVLGQFSEEKTQFIVALEGKGTRDPLDRPFAGRKMSTVDQAYRYGEQIGRFQCSKVEKLLAPDQYPRKVTLRRLLPFYIHD